MFRSILGNRKWGNAQGTYELETDESWSWRKPGLALENLINLWLDSSYCRIRAQVRSNWFYTIGFLSFLFILPKNFKALYSVLVVFKEKERKKRKRTHGRKRFLWAMLELIIFGWHLAFPGPVLSLSFYREQSQAKGTPILKGFYCKPQCTNLLKVKEILLLRLVANLRVIPGFSPLDPHTFTAMIFIHSFNIQ